MSLWKSIQKVFSHNVDYVYETDVPTFDQPFEQVSDIIQAAKRINWKKLKHAYGSASDVPRQLKALISKHQNKRSHAIDTFWGTIWHQGTIYQASAYTTPFLVQLAGHPDVKDREQILELLFSLANGHSYLDVHADSSFAGQFFRSDPNFEEKKARELEWVHRTRQAVIDGYPTYLRLLDDPDPNIRQRALHVLSCCRQQAPAITGKLLEYLEHQTDSAMQACFLLALSVLDPQDQQEQLHKAIIHGKPLVSLAAAIGLAFYNTGPYPNEGVEVLIHFLEHPEEVAAYETLPFADDLFGDIATALSRAQNPNDEQIARCLLNAMEAGRASSFSAIPPLLHFCFHKPRQDWDQAGFTPLQREVVLAIAQKAWSKTKEGHWSIFVNYCDYLNAYGLKKIGQDMVGYQETSKTDINLHKAAQRKKKNRKLLIGCLLGLLIMIFSGDLANFITSLYPSSLYKDHKVQINSDNTLELLILLLFNPISLPLIILVIVLLAAKIKKKKRQ